MSVLLLSQTNVTEQEKIFLKVRFSEFSIFFCFARLFNYDDSYVVFGHSLTTSCFHKPLKLNGILSEGKVPFPRKNTPIFGNETFSLIFQL